MFYVYQIYRIGDYDLTPLGFVVMFAIYGMFSIRFRLFNLKSAASANIFDTLSEGFLVVNNIGQVEVANPAFQRAFPMLKIQNHTSVLEVVDYMRSVAVEYRPADVFDKMASLSAVLSEGECSIQDEAGQLHD